MKNKLLAVWESLKKTVQHFFDKSVWMRLMSIVFAIIIWASVISGDDATWSDTVTDIPVYVIGMEDLEGKGLALKQDVDDLVAETLGTVNALVSGTKGVITNLNTSAFRAVIDLGQILREGQGQTLEIKITGADNVDIKRITPVDSIVVDVEALYTDENVPVTVVFTGTLPEGYIRPSTEYTVYPTRITVSGTESDVQAIKHAYAEIDLTDMTNSISQQYELILTDENFAPIDAQTVKMSTPTVIVRTSIYKMKTVPVQWKGSFVGDIVSGYVLGDVTIIPEEITIAGYAEDIENIYQIYVNSIDLTGYDRPFTRRIGFINQTGVQWMSSPDAEITVEVAERRTTEVITSVPVEYVNAPVGSAVTLSSDTVTVAVDGPASIIDTIARGDVRAYVNLISSNYGDYNMDISFELIGHPGADVVFSRSSVDVKIELAPEE